MGVEFRARRWRRLLNLIEGLPVNSAYMEARAEDEEMARLMPYQLLADAKPKVRWTDWSPEVARLARIEDLLADLGRILIQINGGGAGRRTTSPRPESAFDRIKRERTMEQHRSLVSRLLPHPEGGGGTNGAPAPEDPAGPGGTPGPAGV